MNKPLFHPATQRDMQIALISLRTALCNRLDGVNLFDNGREVWR